MSRTRMILGPWLKPLFTVIMGLVISALIAQVTGYPAWTVLSALWAGSVGNLSNLASTLVILFRCR